MIDEHNLKRYQTAAAQLAASHSTNDVRYGEMMFTLINEIERLNQTVVEMKAAMASQTPYALDYAGAVDCSNRLIDKFGFGELSWVDVSHMVQTFGSLRCEIDRLRNEVVNIRNEKGVEYLEEARQTRIDATVRQIVPQWLGSADQVYQEAERIEGARERYIQTRKHKLKLERQGT